MFDLAMRIIGLFLAIVFSYMIGAALEASDFVLALLAFSFASLMPELVLSFGYWVKDNV